MDAAQRDQDIEVGEVPSAWGAETEEREGGALEHDDWDSARGGEFGDVLNGCAITEAVSHGEVVLPREVLGRGSHLLGKPTGCGASRDARCEVEPPGEVERRFRITRRGDG